MTGTYDILGRAAGDSGLVRATDDAIAAENARVIASMCGDCGGLGRRYLPPAETDSDPCWTRIDCATCGGSGDRS